MEMEMEFEGYQIQRSSYQSGFHVFDKDGELIGVFDTPEDAKEQINFLIEKQCEK